jgi:hypothetical protein
LSEPTISRPDRDEFASFFEKYVELVRDRDVWGVMHGQIPVLRAVRDGLTESEALHRYDAGKWSVKEVLGHLSDTERILSYRLFRISRGDPTPLSPFDENAYVEAAGFDRMDISALVDDFERVRSATLGILAGLSPGALERRGVASGREVSARALAHIIAGHVEHHLRILDERYGVAVPSTVP